LNLFRISDFVLRIFSMKYIDEIEIRNKRVLLRVDFNVSLNPNYTIADDTRIRQGLPSIEYLLKHHNRIILVSHLGRPEKRETKYSLRKVAADLRHYLPHRKITLVDDFLTAKPAVFENQTPAEIILLENIRFYPGEDANDPAFAKQLAHLADVYVNDAFSVNHRAAASIVGITDFLPSYAGLLLKKEITMLDRIVKDPKKPLVTIMGGSKISTKLKLIDRLIEVSDVVLIGGGLANNFLLAKGLTVGKSIIERNEMLHTKHLLAHARKHGTKLMFPVDVVVSTKADATAGTVKAVTEISPDEAIFDIGPHTQAEFGTEIAKANTLLWNGPVGYFENPAFKRGTDYLYYAIAENNHAVSVVGGGETLAALSHKEHLEAITHVSTGGGAMLEYIEHGTLVGIEALKMAK
jgi:phosphoglycerate kinase